MYAVQCSPFVLRILAVWIPTVGMSDLYRRSTDLQNPCMRIVLKLYWWIPSSNICHGQDNYFPSTFCFGGGGCASSLTWCRLRSRKEPCGVYIIQTPYALLFLDKQAWFSVERSRSPTVGWLEWYWSIPVVSLRVDWSRIEQSIEEYSLDHFNSRRPGPQVCTM